MVKIDLKSSNIVKMDEDGALLVEGIEEWIDQLIPATELHPNQPTKFLCMQDSKTGARFFIRRIK